MIAGLYSKSYKLGFSNMWTQNLYKYKLGLEKAEEPEINVCRITEKAREFQKKKKSTSASLIMLKPLTVWITTNWKILKDMGIPTTLTVSWEKCMQVKKQHVEPYMEQLTISKSGKEYDKSCVLSPCLFDLYAEYIMWNTNLDESKARIKIAGRNINNLR